jgi:heat shock protein HslJ
MKSLLKGLFTYFLLCGFLLGSYTYMQYPDALDNSYWELISFQDRQPLSGKRIPLIFEDCDVNVSAGCNSYQGYYHVQGETIDIENIISTMMVCHEPEGVMAQEQSYLAFLGEVKSFRIIEDRLYFSGAGGEVGFLQEIIFVLQMGLV